MATEAEMVALSEVPTPSPPSGPPAAAAAPLEPWQLAPVDSFGHQPIPNDVLLPLLERLPENVQATTCRLLCKALREHFRAKLEVRLDTAGLRAARQRARQRQRAFKASASASSSASTAQADAVEVEVAQDLDAGVEEGESGLLDAWGGVPPHAVEWFLTRSTPHERAHMTLEQRCALRDAIMASHRAGVARQQLQQRREIAGAAGAAAAAAAAAAQGKRHPLAGGAEGDATDGAEDERGNTSPEPSAAPVALTAQGALFWRLRPGSRQAHGAEGDAEDDAEADAAPSPVLHYPSYSLACMLAAVPTQPHGLRHGGAGDGATVVTADRLSALRELTLAAALHGDTDMLTLLARVPGIHEVRHQLTADCAWWAVRGYVPMELLAWAVREPDGPLGGWRSSDAPFLAAALSLRQRASAGDGDGDDAEGPGAAEELRRAVGRLHTAGFGSFHAAGRTFLAAVDLAARGKAAAELVCWLLDCGCPTGPPGWSYVAAIRPLVDGTGAFAFAAAAERCLGLAARLARGRVPLAAAALSGIAALPYDVYCSYITLLVREHGCPVDRTALYGEALDADAAATTAAGYGGGGGRAVWLRSQGLAPPLLLRWRPVGVRALWPSCVLGERGAERGPPLWLALECVPAKCGSGSTSAQFGVVSKVVTERLMHPGARRARRGSERND
ncbi:hypothetical protein HXX76_000384 [Chlamydomonas incerta]|uniref:Uncharacterized protein n=1 Tax=Chlamydomonas incerta TaxID=51695 RepID=A0A835WE63_CHLIN|nr:hypothetical protein HXX76_000384 [Chlamydomonas incerta]|eukprot:KAG2445780.1 hypothetical protein HXX76_000384 [Chlamydomonas incerta]